jgi:hypothetical protein
MYSSERNNKRITETIFHLQKTQLKRARDIFGHQKRMLLLKSFSVLTLMMYLNLEIRENCKVVYVTKCCFKNCY